MKTITALFVFVLFFTAQILPAQTIDWQQQMNAFQSTHLAEKAYLHTDKPYYAIGETIWYSAYLVDGRDHTPGAESQVLYVELFDPNEDRVSLQQLYMSDGQAGGEIGTEVDWEPGTYNLRAYTQFQRNGKPELFYQRTLELLPLVGSVEWPENAVTTEVDVSDTDETTLRPLDVQFMPEGGASVVGLPGIIGVKVLNTQGIGVNVEGKILDEQGNLVTIFRTIHRGMGAFPFQPQAGKNYTAVVGYDDREWSYPVPQPLSSGSTMSIQHKGEELITSVYNNESGGLAGYQLIGHLRGEVFGAVEGTAGQRQLRAVFEVADLPTGVAHFTLFDGQQRPVAERLVFIEGDEAAAVDLKASIAQDIYGTREEVTIPLQLQQGDHGVAGQLSISVTDQQKVSRTDHPENIQTWLLLNSEIKGTIEEPAYYFTHHMDPAKRKQLDLLMLTQGWRRFDWTEEIPPVKYLPEQGLSLTGRVLRAGREVVPDSTHIALDFVGETWAHQEFVADGTGEFNFGPLIFFDTLQGVIQASIPPKRSLRKPSFLRGSRLVDIFLDTLADPAFIPLQEEMIKAGETEAAPFTAYQNTVRQVMTIDASYDSLFVSLDEVEITARRKTLGRAGDPRQTIYGMPSSRMMLDSLPGSIALRSVFDVLRLVPGVLVSGAQGNETVLIRGPNSILGSLEPLYLLDGMVTDISGLRTVPIQDVYFVDVLKGAQASFYGSRGANGVVSVFTRRGDERGRYIPQPGIVDFQWVGFHSPKAFYQPNYSVNDQAEKPDYRTTLHWEPELRLGGTGPEELKFFTSDQQGSYELIIEGISDTGMPVFLRKSFKVQ